MKLTFSIVMALAMILFGAELFTNAVEWLGRRLRLGQGAVGSVLAALGTALPETAVPVTAILWGGNNQSAQEVGIGGILGAPFLLVTLGSAVMALALLLSRKTHAKAKLAVHPRAFQRDMGFFLISYAMALLVGCVRQPVVHQVAPYLLIGTYVYFVQRTLRDKTLAMEQTDLHPLYLQWKTMQPSMPAIMIQLFIALSAIVAGAQVLSSAVEQIAVFLGMPAFVLSALLIPLATELPETFNSVVWIRQGKDALAIGNISGAMVFQSTLVPALGIWLTPWNLNSQALLAGGLTMTAGALIFGMFRLHGTLLPSVLVAASLLYWILPMQTIAVRYNFVEVYFALGILLILLILLILRAGLRQYRDASAG